MPFIEEKNLVNLHKLIEKGEKDLDLANESLKRESGRLEKAELSKKILTFIVGFLVFGLIYAFFFHDNEPLGKQESLVDSQPLNNAEIINDITVVEDTEDLNEGLIYRVQIGVFENFNIKSLEETQPALITKKTSNGKYTYAVGNFTTYAEAASLKSDLIALGFKDAFIVASNDGESIAIEDALDLSNEHIE